MPTTARAIHFVDIENLAGSPVVSLEQAAETLGAYRLAAGCGPDDLLVVASSHLTARRAMWACPGARWLIRSGRNGADLALIGAMLARHIPKRFETDVVGSGDGIFATACAQLQSAGCAVAVVARRESLSRALRFAVRDVRFLQTNPDTAPSQLMRSAA
jgi:hypothetical protein